MHSPILTNPIIEFVDDICTSVFDFFYGRIQKRAEERIKAICRVNSYLAVLERQRLERRRKCLRFFFFLLVSLSFAFIGVWLIRYGYDCRSRLYMSLGVCFVILCVAAFLSIFDKDAGNISTLTTPLVLRLNKPYVLYLRGFDSDRNNNTCFSEMPIVNDLYQQGLYTFTVGLPEEIDAPKGALRVYVNDATWKEEVLAMMVKADGILLRISDTESCRWELEQALSMLDKLYVIVDDINEYNAIRSKYSVFPGIDELPDMGFVMLRREDNNEWEKIIWEKC